eukprot:2104054-Pyramimonas_sp.AAC.1
MAKASRRAEAHQRRAQGPSALMETKTARGANSQRRATRAAHIQTPTTDLSTSTPTALRLA